MLYLRAEQHKSSGATNGHTRNTSMQEHAIVIFLSIIAIIIIYVGRGDGVCAILRESSKRTSTVTRMMTRTSTIPVTVCSDERPGLAVGGGGAYQSRGGWGVATDTARRGTIHYTNTSAELEV